MKNRTLGHVLRARRHAMGITQRELARRINVKPSHIAYLENDRRRPSLMLLGRLADVMGLEKRPLFLLACPEVDAIIKPRSAGKERNHAWRDFADSKYLHSMHHIRPKEMKVLSQVNLLGRIGSSRDFLFILNAIRNALEEED